MGVSERLWSKVERRAPDECWPWTGARAGSGYGYIRDDTGKVSPAHRVVLILDGRDPGPGGVSRHRCDNPICCNPAHLEPGTQAENNLDTSKRGRHGTAKLTPAAVLEIRALHGVESLAAIGSRFGVTKQAIYKVVHGRSWSHAV